LFISNSVQPVLRSPLCLLDLWQCYFNVDLNARHDRVDLNTRYNSLNINLHFNPRNLNLDLDSRHDSVNGNINLNTRHSSINGNIYLDTLDLDLHLIVHRYVWLSRHCLRYPLLFL